MIYKLQLATGEIFNLEVKNIYQAIATGDRFNRERHLMENYTLERLWQEGEEPAEDACG